MLPMYQAPNNGGGTINPQYQIPGQGGMQQQMPQQMNPQMNQQQAIIAETKQTNNNVQIEELTEQTDESTPFLNIETLSHYLVNQDHCEDTFLMPMTKRMMMSMICQVFYPLLIYQSMTKT